MDTQAPITMGEDEDEQTGNYIYKVPPVGGSVKSSQHEAEPAGHERPKYKRQEFMRPKYGAVSFDVIDAVNARLAAASNSQDAPAQPHSPARVINRLRIDTAGEGDPKHFNPVQERVELTIGQPRRDTTSSPSTNLNNNPQQQGSDRAEKKSQKSLTMSVGGNKRYQNGGPAPLNSTVQKRSTIGTVTANTLSHTNAMAEDDAALGGRDSAQLPAWTIVSRALGA